MLSQSAIATAYSAFAVTRARSAQGGAVGRIPPGVGLASLVIWRKRAAVTTNSFFLEGAVGRVAPGTGLGSSGSGSASLTGLGLSPAAAGLLP